jgi:ABC-2 type transport system permease protein
LKILATIHKEFLLLVRDLGGLALIFLMPLALVVVMALIQDAPFRDYQEIKLEVLLVNEDKDSLGNTIQNVFESSTNVTIIPMTDTVEAKALVQAGKYKAAVILPAGASGSLRKKIQQLMSQIFTNVGINRNPPDTTVVPPVDVSIVFDPAIKVNYTQALSSALEKVIADIQSKWMLEELQSQLGTSSTPSEKVKIDFSSIVRVNHHFASEKNNNSLVLNSVQHNVPAWTIFAMFFILFPLAGNFIKEREEGSMLRLRLISGSQFAVIAGKFSFYFGICMLQCLLMIIVGIYLMPLLGLKQLVLGSNIIGVALTAGAVAMAATGYGLLIAVYFNTPQQALSFGSISVVILAAMGGVWVPIYVMPEALQRISRFSPLNWGLESFNDLFLRDSSTLAILPELLKLTSFSIVTLAASFFIHKSRTIRS